MQESICITVDKLHEEKYSQAGVPGAKQPDDELGTFLDSPVQESDPPRPSLVFRSSLGTGSAISRSKIPLEKRMTTSTEIANMTAVLLSNVSSHTTGQIVYVDGGYTHLDRSIS